MSKVNLTSVYNRLGNRLKLDASDYYEPTIGQYFSDYIQATNLDLSKIKDLLNQTATVDIVPTIEARDKKDVESGAICWVIDASSDPTVNKGSACYVAKSIDDKITWYKITEEESLERALYWADIKGKPKGTSKDIDLTVDKAHEHDDKRIIDKISRSERGYLVYNGVELSTTTGIEFKTSLNSPVVLSDQLIIVSEFFEEAGSIETPIILIPDNEIVYREQFIVKSSEFKTVDKFDTHKFTEYRIATNPDGFNPIYNIVTSENKIYHTFKDIGLNPGINYYISCRYIGFDIGNSNWSEWKRFTVNTKITFDIYKIFRDPISNAGSYIEYMEDGLIRRYLILDAKYRIGKYWGTYDIEIPEFGAYRVKDLTRFSMYDYIYNRIAIESYQLTEELSNNQYKDVWLKYNNISDKRIITGVPAIDYVNLLQINGKSCNIPTIKQLEHIYKVRNLIDKLDISLKDYPEYALGDLNIKTPWSFPQTSGEIMWSCSPYDSKEVMAIDNKGNILPTTKYWKLGVIPIQV